MVITGFVVVAIIDSVAWTSVCVGFKVAVAVAVEEITFVDSPPKYKRNYPMGKNTGY